jgi:hypothetical protein
MATSSILRKLSIAVALIASAAPAALALTHSGGASIGEIANVKLYDASNPQRPILTEQTEALTQSGAFVFSHDALFVAAGSQVRRYDGRDLSQPASATWSASSSVKAIADGTERGLLLVLDAANLTLVKFPDGGTPAAVWSYPIDESAAGSNPGRILIRDGNRAFVADASIPGVRIVTAEPDQAPGTIATYASPDGIVNDMSLWGGRLALATAGGLAIVNVSQGDAPSLTRLGGRLTSSAATRVDANSKFALVAEGQNLDVFDIELGSTGFLANSLDGWDAPADIRSVRLDKANRAYVLVDGAYEIFDLATYGGR